MIMPIVEALRGWDVQPGVTYRTKVDGHTLEFRLINDDDVPTPALEEQVMLQPWVEIPFFPQGTVIARPGPLPLPDLPIIPDDDEKWS